MYNRRITSRNCTIGGDVTYGGSSIKSYVREDKRQGKRRDEVIYES